MSIRLYPPDDRQDAGFYHFLFDALRRHAGAEWAGTPRPLSRMEQPRQHESVWIDWNGIRLLLDMSDHVFLFDLPALRECDVYLKTNLNPALARRILQFTGEEALLQKIRPFLFLPPKLPSCLRLAEWSRQCRRGKWRPFDCCHIVGVYQNPFLDGIPVEADADVRPDPATIHFWSRYHVMQALKHAGLKGMFRLTNRGNPQLLDSRGVVQKNLPPFAFLAAILGSHVTVLNTLPHAVLPWKAWESLALGVPFVLERRPLTELPSAFALTPGVHYLELLPELPGFNERVPPDELSAYRLIPSISLSRLKERAEWLAEEIRNPDRMPERAAAVEEYRRRILNANFLSRYLAEEMEKWMEQGASL